MNRKIIAIDDDIKLLNFYEDVLTGGRGWNSPTNSDGSKTTKHIREADDRIFIVVITGYLDESIYRFQEVLHHDVLCCSKPMRAEEIYQMAKTSSPRAYNNGELFTYSGHSPIQYLQNTPVR